MSLRTLSYYWREALQSIARNSWLSAASVGTVAVSLLIVGIFALLVVNANEFTRGLESGLEVRVILRDGQSRENINKLQKEIERLPGVSLVEFVSKDQALEEMKRNLQNRREILEGLQNDNPLPDAFRIKAVQADQIPELAGRLERLNGVDQVIYGHGLVEKLVSATRWVRVAGTGILGILCLAAVFLISTTIRMSVFARRREIGIMVLLGATNWFVRFPYLLEGMILGFLGAVLAGLAVYAGYMSLANYIDQSLPFIHPVTDQRTIIMVLGGVLGTGLVIGALGSILSIRRFLKI
ncbi:MAG: permease-like cell division protein FtsX [Peptococcaceae bacterium]|nr:permease-like cell division protein FtsX [Peptococcaceae bacterium]